MSPIMIALLLARDLLFPALGIVGGVLLVTKTRAGRRVLDRLLARPQDDADLADLRDQVQHLQNQLDDTLERLDATERMLGRPDPPRPRRSVTPV